MSQIHQGAGNISQSFHRGQKFILMWKSWQILTLQSESCSRNRVLSERVWILVNGSGPGVIFCCSSPSNVSSIPWMKRVIKLLLLKYFFKCERAAKSSAVFLTVHLLSTVYFIKLLSIWNDNRNFTGTRHSIWSHSIRPVVTNAPHWHSPLIFLRNAEDGDHKPEHAA